MGSPTVEALVQHVLRGDAGAWQMLWQHVEPRLWALVRRPRFLGPLSQSEEDCRNIVVEVMDALQAQDHARLRRFADARARNPALPFFAWLTVVAKRLAIDYMRRHEAYQDLRRAAQGPHGAWRETTALPADSQLPGGRPPITNLSTAAELLAYAGSDLPAEQRAALAAWMEGRRFDEIAQALGLPQARKAEKLVRAALERLRRRFRDGGAA